MRCQRHATVNPEDVTELAARFDRHVVLASPTDGRLDRFNAVFEVPGG